MVEIYPISYKPNILLRARGFLSAFAIAYPIEYSLKN